MDSKIRKVYFIYALLMVIFTIIVGLFCNNKVYSKENNSKVEEFSAIETIIEEGNTITMEGTIKSVKNCNYLSVYTLNEEMFVYIDGNLIYSLTKGDNIFGKTSGIKWNFIPVYTEYVGKHITIEITSCYDTKANKVPTIYYGQLNMLKDMIFKTSILPMLICIIIFIIGLLIIIIGFYINRKIPGTNSLVFLGIFAILYSIWSINETKAITLFITNSILSANLAYIILLLMPIPFILFARNIFQDKHKPVWDFLCILNFIVIIIVMALQILNVYEFRKTLILTHGLIVIITLNTLRCIIYDTVKNPITKEIKFFGISLIILVVGVFLDLGSFYIFRISTDSGIFGRIGFLAYITILSYKTIQNGLTLLSKGTEAEVYERMAMTDQLTGMYNRNAFSKELYEAPINEIKYTVIMMDLNDLKKCNDTYGHIEGDNYIIQSANIIKSVTTKFGKCYRIGGDEFCIIEQYNDDNYYNIKKQINNKIKIFNACNNSVKINIAIGVAVYNRAIDKNLDDTRKRADKLMYEDKRKLKECEL